MILVQYKERGSEYTHVHLTVKNKVLTGTVTFDVDVEEENEIKKKELSYTIPEKDLANVENSLFVLLGNENGIDLLDGYRYTESYRDRLLYLKRMLNTEILLIIKVGKKTQDNEDLNLQIETSHTLRKNLSFDTSIEIKEEQPPFIDGIVFSKYDRKKIYPCYALVLNGQEYHADDEGNQLNDTDTVVTYTGDSIDLCIKKYDYGFNNVMNEQDDADKVYIETTCGIINARMTYLENGEKHLVFNPLGYEGAFTIKIGWRWNPVVNQYDLVMKKEG